MKIEAIKTLWPSIKDRYFCLQMNQRFYVNAGVTFLIYLVISQVLPPEKAKGLFGLFFLLWVIAISFDLLALYKKVHDSILIKAGLIVVASLCTNFALVISSQIVNEITGIDPSGFPHTVALLSILSIPVFIAAGLGISLLLLLTLSPVFIMLCAYPNDKIHEVLIPGYSANTEIPYPRITHTVQVVSFAIFCGYVLYFAEKTANGYITFISDTARSFLYQWEMYPKAPCNMPKGARVAFIDSETILVAEKNSSGITFNLQECKGS